MSEFRDKVRSMTAKEIILAMVDSLRNPVCEIDMDTFGSVSKLDYTTCYGCAATNTIAKLLGYEKLTPDLLLDTDSGRMWPEIKIISFVSGFEMAIDSLRRGDVYAYNDHAIEEGFAEIPIHDDEYDLPYLTDSYTEEDLQAYEDYANNHC